MRRVIIVEDEMLAAKRLQKLLDADTDHDFEVMAILDSVKSTAKWLANNPRPDLLFMDIQLGDGLSFEVFDIVDVSCPVIFITAYNEYAVAAFKLNSISYILIGFPLIFTIYKGESRHSDKRLRIDAKVSFY